MIYVVLASFPWNGRISMKITLIIGADKKIREIPENTTIKDLLEQLDMPSEAVVVKKNNEIAMEEEPLEDGDIVEIIRVIYGG